MKPLKILLLEDMPADAELIEMELSNANIQFENVRVDTRGEFISALNQFTPDVILADHSVASFNSLEALTIVKEKHISSPFLIVTTAMPPDFANTMIKEGASDCILKDKLHQLPLALKFALNKNTFNPPKSFVEVAPTEKLFDLSLLEEMDDNDYIIEIVSIFLSETPRELAEMQKAAALGKLDIISGKAHKLKSSAGLIEANTLLKILREIEDFAKSLRQTQVIPLVENAVKEYKEIEAALKNHLENLS
jgi:DNA-binding NarL/FixJ family response regulator